MFVILPQVFEKMALGSVIMPIVAFATTVLVGFIIKPQAIIDEVKVTNGTFKSQRLFAIMIKWISPIFIALIMITSILEALGIFKL